MQLRKTGHLNAAFTLIELLMVVAVIAILALIALPNFLEAQTRAKVSRVKAELKTIATGLEAYCVDCNNYPPNDGVYNVIPIQLTTPVAFLTNSKLVDPFSDKIYDPTYGDLARYYTYTKPLTAQEYINLPPGPQPPVEAIDNPTYNLGALARYGRWRLASNGPDRKYSQPGIPPDCYNPHPTALAGADIPYDPTNGTVSFGNILRTQKHVDGAEPDCP